VGERWFGECGESCDIQTRDTGAAALGPKVRMCGRAGRLGWSWRGSALTGRPGNCCCARRAYLSKNSKNIDAIWDDSRVRRSSGGRFPRAETFRNGSGRKGAWDLNGFVDGQPRRPNGEEVIFDGGLGYAVADTRGTRRRTCARCSGSRGRKMRSAARRSFRRLAGPLSAGRRRASNSEGKKKKRYRLPSTRGRL